MTSRVGHRCGIQAARGKTISGGQGCFQHLREKLTDPSQRHRPKGQNKRNAIDQDALVGMGISPTGRCLSSKLPILGSAHLPNNTGFRIQRGSSLSDLMRDKSTDE